jgi:HAMP domain-containing protein
MNSHGSRRKWFRWNTPGRYVHLKYLGCWVLICLAQGALMIAMIWLIFRQSHDADGSHHFDKLMYAIGIPAGLYAAAIGLLAVTTAQRISGPYAALRRTVAAIRAGDHSRRLRFRRHDHLDDLASEFNQMLDALLRKKQPPE